MISKDELIEALRGLNPEQLSGILSQGYGRSPIKPRQLHNLTLPPTATDPRPLFIPSVDAPRDEIITHLPFPKLLWHKGTGQEITVGSQEELEAKGPDWTSVPPNMKPIDPVEHARLMFESLSDEDKAFVIEQQRQARLNRVNSVMGGLSEHQAAAAMSGEKKRARKES